MEASASTKCAPKLTKHTLHNKAGLEERNEILKRKFDGKGAEATPKKARPDKQNGAGEIDSDSGPGQNNAKSLDEEASNLIINNVDILQVQEVDDVEIIEPHATQNETRTVSKQATNAEDELGELDVL